MAHEAGVEGGARLIAELRARSRKWSAQQAQAGFFDPEIASIAFFNEYGFKNIRHQTYVAPRPFMRYTVRDSLDRWRKALSYLIAKGRSSKEALDYVGMLMARDIDRHIEMKDLYNPNAPFTKEKKEFDWPLVETMRMFKAVSYKVRRLK